MLAESILPSIVPTLTILTSKVSLTNPRLVLPILGLRYFDSSCWRYPQPGIASTPAGKPRLGCDGGKW